MTKLDFLFDPKLEQKLVTFVAQRVQNTALRAAAAGTTGSLAGGWSSGSAPAGAEALPSPSTPAPRSLPRAD